MVLLEGEVVVPYIGTWIETSVNHAHYLSYLVVPYIGTWIETPIYWEVESDGESRTLYRYVD